MTKDKTGGESKSYNVILKTLTGNSVGVMTRSSFESQSDFERWYGQNMRDGTNRPITEVYGVVAQGISNSYAERIIASSENTNAVIGSLLREQVTTLNRARRSVSALVR